MAGFTEPILTLSNPFECGVKDSENQTTTTMTTEQLQQLGITKEEILERITDRILSDGMGEEGFEHAKREIVKGYKEGIEKAINHVISKECAEALTMEFQPVNMWGEKTGQPTTVRDLFVKKCQDWWTQKVDGAGNPTTDSYGRKTMVQFQVEKAVAEIANNEMKAAMQSVVADAKAALANSIGNYVRDHVAKKI